MLIYATACGIGKTLYEYIFSKLRTTTARSNVTRDGVNPDEQCDGDHCFHRLMLISNSIYFCFPMDHTTNKCLSVHRRKARDWNYTLVQREYVCGTRLFINIKQLRLSLHVHTNDVERLLVVISMGCEVNFRSRRFPRRVELLF